jgi:hypothetical protein
MRPTQACTCSRLRQSPAVVLGHGVGRKAFGVGRQPATEGDLPAGADLVHQPAHALDCWDVALGGRVVQRPLENR